MKVARDKVLHFALCAAIAVAVMLVMRLIATPLRGACVGALSAAIAAGFAKEYGDHANPRNKWDWYDIAADCAGAVTGTALGALVWLI